MLPSVWIPMAVSAAMGGAQMGMSIFGANAQNASARRQYQDALRFQKVSDKYARWSSKINARIANTQSKYRYWAETVNYNQNLSYVNQLRNYELTKAYKQADVVRRTRTSAMADFSLQSQALSEGIREQAAQDAVSAYQYAHQAMKAQSQVVAAGQEGASVDRLVNDYARQLGDFEVLKQINQNFRERQYTREQAGLVANYISRYNSQQFYDPAPYQDPVRPFAPLPTLVMPQPPSMTGAGPSQAAANLTMGNAVLGGINTGLSVWQGLQQFTSSGKAGAGAVGDLTAGIRQYGGSD
jgi:hypothetical protein